MYKHVCTYVDQTCRNTHVTNPSAKSIYYTVCLCMHACACMMVYACVRNLAWQPGPWAKKQPAGCLYNTHMHIHIHTYMSVCISGYRRHCTHACVGSCEGDRRMGGLFGQLHIHIWRYTCIRIRICWFIYGYLDIDVIQDGRKEEREVVVLLRWPDVRPVGLWQFYSCYSPPILSLPRRPIASNTARNH